MLRTLKHAFNAPRLLGVKATSLSSALTVNISPDDFTAATSAAAGRALLTLGDSFQRAGVVVAAPYTSLGTSPSAEVFADPAYNTVSLRSVNNNAGADGILNALILGYDSQETLYTPYGQQLAPFHVKNAWNASRIEAFKVTPDATTPTIDIGNDKATLTRNGVGDYTVTFKAPFSSDNVVAVPTVIGAALVHASVTSVSALAVRILVQTAGSATDSYPFYLVVQGSDNPYIGSRQRKATRVSDRLPRLVAGHVAYSGGTPSIVNGTGDFTLTDTGSGELTITLVNPFKREPIVIASKDTAGVVTLATDATEDTVVLNQYVYAGTLADANDVHFMIFGFDDTEEYAI